MRAFKVRFLVSGEGWVDKGEHTCDDAGVGALQARFRQEADASWAQHRRYVNQVDFLEVQASDDPFVAYAASIGLAVRRTYFPGPGRHAVQLDLLTPVPQALQTLIERFGDVTTLKQDGSVYRQFGVTDVGEDCYLAIETRRDDTPQLWFKHNVDATFFPYKF